MNVKRAWRPWATVALLMGLTAGAEAAPDVMLHPDPTITIDVPKFGLVVPFENATPAVDTTWSLTLTSSDTNPTDGITFTASEADTSSPDYSLRVYTNTNVEVKLNDGRIEIGDGDGNLEPGETWALPVYGWSLRAGSGGTLNASTYTAQDPANPAVSLYTSGTARHGAILDLTGFQVTVTDLTTFPPGSYSGTLVVTIEAV